MTQRWCKGLALCLCLAWWAGCTAPEAAPVATDTATSTVPDGVDAQAESDVAATDAGTTDAVAETTADATKQDVEAGPVPCLPPPPGPAARLSGVEILPSGQGCDWNGDGKVDNSLGKVVSLYKEVNTLLNEQVDDGTIMWLMVADGPWQSSGVRFMTGEAVLPCPDNQACQYQPKTSLVDGVLTCNNVASYSALIGLPPGGTWTWRRELVGPPPILEMPVTGIVVKVNLHKMTIWTQGTGDGPLGAKQAFVCGIFGTEGPDQIPGQRVPDVDLDSDGRLDAGTFAAMVTFTDAEVIWP